MSIYKYQQGLGSVGAYQVSGTPYVTGSVVQNGDGTGAGEQFKISFPKVTKSFKIQVTGTAPLRIHFSDVTESPALVNEKNFFLAPSDLNHCGSGSALNFVSGSSKNNPYEFNVKCKEVYISSNNFGQSGFQLVAELTGIPATEMIPLSGSGINGTGS